MIILKALIQTISGTISNQSKLQRAPPRFLSERTLMSHPSFEDSPPYSILSDGGSGSYSSVPNRSPGHSYYFPTIFVPGHSLLKTGRQLIFEKSRHIKVKLSLLFPSLASRK